MIKVTIHPSGKYVVNTPGSHLQRQPRTYGSLESAIERVRELQRQV